MGGSPSVEPVATMHAARGLPAMPPRPGQNFDPFGLPQGVSQSVTTMGPAPGLLQGPTLTPVPYLTPPPPPVLNLGQDHPEPSIHSVPPAPQPGILMPPWLDVN